MRTNPVKWWLALMSRTSAAGFLLVALSHPLSAATFVVDQFFDANGPCTPGSCSLREAVLAANAQPGVDVIQVPAGVHELTIEDLADAAGLGGDLNALEPVQILGASLGTTVIDGNQIDRIFSLFPLISETGTYVLSDLTLRGGSRDFFGGALFASGITLEIRRCIFEANHANDGGALFLGNVATSIDSSTFRNNSAAGGGGAIFRVTQVVDQQLIIENSTFSGNTAGVVGGAIVSQEDSVLTLRNVTIARNVAPFGSALFLDGIAASGLVLESSILEGECGWASSDFPPTSLGGNLQGPGDSCFLTHQSDQSSVADLGLGPLVPSENGYVHELLPGSPAIDAALTCPDRDQRGAPRPLDGDGDGVAACDAGSYELGTPTGLADIPSLGKLGFLLFAASLAAGALFFLRWG